MAKTVVGLMETPGAAESVVRELTGNCRCSRSEIGLMASGIRSEVAGGAGTTVQSESDVSAEGLKGAGTGAAIGGALGLVEGIASLTIPGLGPLIAAGPIAAALAGVGIGAAAGGLIGALVQLGVPEEDAQYYAEAVRRGGTLITVHTDSDAVADCAVEVMQRHGASDIEERAAALGQEGWAGATGEQGLLPVAEEQLFMRQRSLTPGSARVYRSEDLMDAQGTGRNEALEAGQDSAVHTPAYRGPERRQSVAGYGGIERRAAAR